MNETILHDWNSILTEFDTSQMSAKAFADSKGIKTTTFYWQLRKRKNNAAKTSAQQLPIDNKTEPVFIPIVPKPATIANQSCISVSVGDVSINVEPGFDKQLLREVIQVLKTVC